MYVEMEIVYAYEDKNERVQNVVCMSHRFDRWMNP